MYRWAIAARFHCPPSEQDSWTVEVFNDACNAIDELTGG